MKRYFCAVAFMALGLFCGTSNGQLEITLDVVQDAGYFGAGFNGDGVPSFASQNMGAHTHAPVGKTHGDRLNRGAFQFDIAGLITSSAAVTGATFEFEVTVQGGPEGQEGVNFDLHRLLNEWDEGTGGSNVGEDTGDGITWANATATDLRTKLGGDFEAMSLGATFVGGPDDYTISSDDLASYVQNVLNGSTNDSGLLLKANPETVDGSAARVTTREANNGARLVVQFNATILLADVNLDGGVNLLDVLPFIDRISNRIFQFEADCNEDGTVDLLDVATFVQILQGK